MNTRTVAPLFLILAFFLPGCARSYSSTVRDFPSQNKENAYYLKEVPPVAQKAYQCGPAALESVYRYWKKTADAESISRALVQKNSRGILNISLAQHAKEQGFWTESPKLKEENLKSLIRNGIPPVVMLQMGMWWAKSYHFVVLKGYSDSEKVFYANTGEASTQTIPYAVFRDKWKNAGSWTLLICPAERVYWDLPPSASNELGLQFEREAKFDEAVRWYKLALAKEPDNEILRFNLANAYLKKRDFEEAKLIYTELLKKKPGWTEAANNLAWVHVEEGDYPEAYGLIENALQKGAQRRYDILDTLGLAYAKTGLKDRAHAIFLEALEKVPTDNTGALVSIKAHLEESKEAGFVPAG